MAFFLSLLVHNEAGSVERGVGSSMIRQRWEGLVRVRLGIRWRRARPGSFEKS